MILCTLFYALKKKHDYENGSIASPDSKAVHGTKSEKSLPYVRPFLFLNGEVLCIRTWNAVKTVLSAVRKAGYTSVCVRTRLGIYVCSTAIECLQGTRQVTVAISAPQGDLSLNTSEFFFFFFFSYPCIFRKSSDSGNMAGAPLETVFESLKCLMVKKRRRERERERVW